MDSATAFDRLKNRVSATTTAGESVRSAGATPEKTQAGSSLLPLTARAFNAFDDGKSRPDDEVWQQQRNGPSLPNLSAMARYRILIVDNNRAMRDTVRSLLVSFGIVRIREAKSGLEGLDRMQASMPDLVITDYDMAPMSGLDFAQRARRVPHADSAPAPIIMTTKQTHRRRIVAIRGANVADILAKPITPLALAQRIVSATHARRSAEAGAALPPTAPTADPEEFFWI